MATPLIEVSDLTFLLHSGPSTYAVAVSQYGHLHHVYWGSSLSAQNMGAVVQVRGRAFSPNPIPGDSDFSLDTVPLEYPAYGNSDFRSPAIEILDPATGSRVLDLRYSGHEIHPGKPSLAGLPATFADAGDAGDARTLVIVLRDASLKIAVELCYTAFANHPVIVRSSRIVNEGSTPLEIRRALSASVDFPNAISRHHFLHLHGAWTRETQVASQPLHPGTQSIESRRGASSHVHNPFFALAELGAHERFGTVFAFQLVYSGNFLASIEVDPFESPRAQVGLNPFDFSWCLEPECSFQTPEALLSFSDTGLGGLSRSLHRFQRRHLLPPAWSEKPRPIVINNWEATYFDFDADKIESIARDAADLGMELLVLDDGWFGRRDQENCSLGDWVAHPGKLPHGLPDLAERVRRHGLDFGLWFEPEMISPDSDLHRSHPDWCLHVPTHPRTEGRHQLILDLSRPEVCEEIHRRITRILREVPISFVKWDMNRNMTEIGSATREPKAQQETAHRYMLGLYSLLHRITDEFPHILFESCSGGGGRLDAGMLRFMPQVWTSDNSDAISRLRIQYGASIAYPFSALSAHVSTVPNHQVGRITPLQTRGHVAFTGAFGYELDTAFLTEQEKAEVRQQIIDYKQWRELLLGGELYRLRSPFEGNDAAWMVVSPERDEALVTYVKILSEPNPSLVRLRLEGLDLNAHYNVPGFSDAVPGDFLIRVGLPISEAGADFTSQQWHLRRV